MAATTEKEVLRCSKRQCVQRPRLHNPEPAWTPLARKVHDQHELDAAGFAGSLPGLRVPQDAALRIAERGEAMVDSTYKLVRVAAAFCHLGKTKNSDMPAGIIRKWLAKKPACRQKPTPKRVVHTRQLFVGAHRQTRATVLRALPEKQTAAGCMPHIQRPSKHIVGSDASRSLKACCDKKPESSPQLHDVRSVNVLLCDLCRGGAFHELPCNVAG